MPRPSVDRAALLELFSGRLGEPVPHQHRGEQRAERGQHVADGEDGTGALVQPELAEAAGRSTKVIVAQETGNVEPSYVTFYGSSKNEFQKAVAGLYASLGAQRAFGGVAVHYLDSYLALKK